MALTLDATVGGLTSNSYLDRVTADALLAGRLQADAWFAADSSAGGLREQALVSATARLEQENYAGIKQTDGQALKWPRAFVPNDDDTNYLNSGTIPVPIQQATCEMALYLLVQLASGTDPLQPTGLEGFSRVKIGVLDVTPRNDDYVPGELPPTVARWLTRLAVGGGGTVRLRRS